MSGPIVFGEAAEALFRLSAPTAVSAGAGSGKTTALVELCVRLLSGEATGTPCEPSALVAITFTEKAAEELVLRLREAVAERARAAARAAPGSDVAQAWLDRLHGLDRMAAGTIHAFCGRLLREHAPEAGLDPEFTVVDEERASAWLRAAARAAVVAALDAGRPAARLLTAGLGAEARGGLAGLVAELVRARATRGDAGPVPVAPVDEAALRSAWERLGAAAGDVVTLARAARGAGAQKLLDAVARAWVALEGATHGTPGEDAPARLRALEEATHGPRLGKDDATLREARDALRAHADEVSRLEADRLAGPQKEELALLVADSEARYAARKREARAMDFDDLLVRARDLLAGDRALVAELRGRLGALLVDEYQDVNALQQQVFDLLAGPGEPRGPTLVAVGDLKQSIYRFRGADVSVFARLVRRFGAGEGRVLHLSANHRSAPAVLDLVNEVSARCMVPPAGAAPRDDEIRFGDADRLVPRRPEGARPACEVLVDDGGGAAAERRLREADAIVRRIQAMVSGAAGVVVRERGEGGVERTRRPRFGDVAVLFRRLTQIGPYERALRAAGLPFRLARGGGFYQAPEVRDLGELAATLFDPSDALAWAALLRSPLCAVSDGTLVLVARGGLGRLGWIAPEALRAQVEAIAAEARSGRAPAIPPDEWERLVRLLRVWQDLRAVRDRLALPDLLRRAVAALDLDAALLAAPEGERRAVNLEKAIALAARFEADGGRAPELARHLRALAARPPREPEAELEAEDAIAILSVHQAKGLEWPIVLVPDLGAAARADTRRALLDADGRLCAQLYDAAREEHVETAAMRSAREAERRAAAAESRRLLYVALTRARDRLVLSGEPGRGGESWRGLVEVAAEARPDLVLRVPASEAATRAAAPALPAAAPAAQPRQPLLAAPRLAPPAPLAAVRVAVTDLAEYARCPRRHHLGRFLRIPEPTGLRGGAHDDPGRATARGTLAHAMLAESDLAAPPLERRAQLQAAAARRGYDPASAGIRRILAEVARFADSEGGRALAVAAREGRLSREVPFLLRVDGGPLALGEGLPRAEPRSNGGAPAAYLVGAIDALVAGRRGEGVVVVDYKYAAPRPGAAERYRLQLLAYTLAARRAFPGVRVRARLQFLRGDFRAVDVTATERELADFAREAPALAMGAHAGTGGDLAPAALGRDEARCRAEGCGYVSRCFPVRPATERPGA
ncbi:MAG TPA: UvrD-helicase domain-containing protein [Anaeromyxobacter sp.]